VSVPRDFKNNATVYREDELTRNRYYGIWRGRVEYNQDPLQRGRIKVRVNEVYGLFDGGEVNMYNWWIPTERLPWAEVIHPFGGGYDHGSYIIPEVGDSCFVIFEKADPSHPLVIGYWYASPEEEQKMCKNPDESQPPDWLFKSMGTWYGKNAPEPPLESQGIRNLEPTRRVFYKSPKGHVFLVEDRDEDEFIELLDRTGQGLRIEGYVSKDYNVANASQRNYHSVFRHDSINRDALKNGRARIILKGLSGSFLEIDSKPDRERILINARASEEVDENLDEQCIELLPYRGKILIESMKDGQVRSSITIDGSSGGIEINTTDYVTINSPKVTINGSVKISKDLTVGGNINAGGNVVASRFIGQYN
jgi:hypothetical protein